MARTTPQSGQLKDPLRRLGHGASGLILERFADQLSIGGHFTDRPIDVPTPESVQAALPERDHVTLNCGPTNANDFGRLLACYTVVKQPEHEHFFADTQIGVRGPFLVNDSLLLFGQLDTKPSHGVHPCVANPAKSTSLPSQMYFFYHSQPESKSLSQFRAGYNRTTATAVITFQDNLSGLDLASISNLTFYHLSAKPLSNRVPEPRLILPTSVSVAPGASPLSQEVVTVVFPQQGKGLRAGRYLLKIDAGVSGNGVEDAAGNALDGKFSGRFPSGNGVPGSDFLALISASHNRIQAATIVKDGHFSARPRQAGPRAHD